MSTLRERLKGLENKRSELRKEISAFGLGFDSWRETSLSFVDGKIQAYEEIIAEVEVRIGELKRGDCHAVLIGGATANRIEELRRLVGERT